MTHAFSILKIKHFKNKVRKLDFPKSKKQNINTMRRQILTEISCLLSTLVCIL